MIIVMLVCPIGTRTQFFAAAGKQTPVPWPAQTPERAARAIMQGSNRDKHSV